MATMPTSIWAYSGAVRGSRSWAANWSMSKEEVAAHMVNLAWNGLRGMKARPTLHSDPADGSRSADGAAAGAPRQGTDSRTEAPGHCGSTAERP